MTGPSFRKSAICLLVASAAVTAPAVAQQQARMTALEEVIVTAQRREESLQDAPVSITAFSETRLENMGFTDLGDLQNSVPNFSMREMPNSKTAMRTFIRGIGNNDVQITQDPAVAVYLDGIYNARSTGITMELVDVERIEVLRGPQGSLYGRNATGGAVNVVSKKPSGEFGVTQKFTVGNYGLWRSQTTVELPEYSDVSTRLTYIRGARDGWVKNAGLGKDPGEEDREAWRLALRWTPGDDLTVDYVYDHSKMDFTTHYAQTLQPIYPGFVGAEQAPVGKGRQSRIEAGREFEESELEVFGHSLVIEYALSDSLVLKSMTGYRELEEILYMDYAPNPNPNRLFANDLDTNQRQWSQEFQLLGEVGARFNYIAGLYYFREKGTEFTTDYLSLFGSEMILQTRRTQAENRAWAAFGQVSWTPPVLEDRLKLTAGARYSEDERRVVGSRLAALDTVTYFDVKGSDDWDNWSLSAIAEYEITDNQGAYLKFTQGYRTGGFNGRANTAAALLTQVDEETVDAWELGYKATWFDNRLRSNLAIFMMEYDDLQLSFANPNNTADVRFFNAGDAELRGLDLDITAVPVDGLLLSFQYGYLQSKLKDIVNPFTGDPDFGKYRLPSAPRHTVAVDAEYTFPTTRYGTWIANLNYSYRDESVTSAPIYSTPNARIDSYGLWNARLTLADIPVGSEAEMRVALWGKNLADKEYLVDVVGAFSWSSAVGSFGHPRSFGVDLTLDF